MLSEVERVKRRWEREDKTDLDSAISTLLSAPAGHKFLWWLLSIGEVGGQPFSPDAGVTAFNCGKLNVGNQIMARLMEASPDGYTEMQKEMLNARTSRDAELNAASDRDAASSGAGEWEPPGGPGEPEPS
jgi:hypothetical protein